MNEDNTKSVWKSQPTATLFLSDQDLIQYASKFQRTIRRRNLGESIAALLVVAVFSFYMWKFPTMLMQIGSGMTILACIYAIVQLHRRASAQALPGIDAAIPTLAFHRQQLVRQRDALRSVWAWYVAPFIPGVIVFRWGVETELGAGAPFARGAPANAMIAGVFVIVILVNFYAAWKLQRQINKLDQQQA
jgi:hypothetical protein